MKRWILMLAVLALVLAGCGNEQPDSTRPQNDPAAQTTAPAGATALLDPDSPLTARTGGALQAYPLEDGNYTRIIPVEGGLLLLNTDYFGDSTLSFLSVETGSITARRDLSTRVEDALRVVGDRILYYDWEDSSLVTLGEGLQEVSRVMLPEEMAGEPLISGDGTQVYYHTGPQIRVLELQTGISRLLRDHGEHILNLAGLYCDDEVLKIYTDDTDEDMGTQYLSTVNGETLHYGDDTLSLETRGEQFYAELGGAAGELLFGRIGGEVKLLDPFGNDLWTKWLPTAGGAVNCISGDGSWTLNYYDLASGLRTASVTLADSGMARGMVEDLDGNIWFLYLDEDSSQEILCRWDLSKSAIGDDQVYTGRRYTAESPDTAGLAACKEEAARIGETYGVEILLWEDVLAYQPGDYSFRTEHQVEVIEQSLQAIEKALARYPEGFLETAASRSESGMIHICLVGGIHGDEKQGTLASTEGIQYWLGSEPYMALRVSGDVEGGFYHEMCHIIETRVLGKTTIYDGWESLNPKGFKYDYDYIANLDRADDKYLEGEDRAFVDVYAMSYPKEDRARIMEYAMMEGNEEVFASDWMQRKLLRLCRGIRRAFGLSKYEEVLPWEVYLEDSLVP